MKKFGMTTLLALSLSASALALPTLAHATNSNSFTTTVKALNAPVKINVILSEDMIYRADHLSKNMRDRSNSMRSLNNGFAGQGKYGQKDLDRLTARMKRKMEARLVKDGFTVDDNAASVLTITIVDARPNRPTFRQSASSGLSQQSYGIGGAKFEASLTQNGQDLGMLSYGWYETDIREAQYSSTWGDANRAIDRFARKTAKSFK
ncbi:MAG: hypothetical protein COA43_16275 [Robiginitomaculum sp.]|nr:MAG: hypothetical protein COA43_16275 [Robiginitomaculum sp.]